jgi:hypothetical protein
MTMLTASEAVFQRFQIPKRKQQKIMSPNQHKRLYEGTLGRGHPDVFTVQY